MRQLYVYYRVPQARLATVLSSVLKAQTALRAATPGLETDLMRRADEHESTPAEVTLMETYRMRADAEHKGLSDAQAAHIEAAMTEALAEAGVQAPVLRHVEVFEPIIG